MNLGDGLMFELDNGKPKLVLTHHGESKASSKMGYCQQVPSRNRAQKATVPSKQWPKEAERAQRDRKGRAVDENQAEHGVRSTKPTSSRHPVGGAVRTRSESKTESSYDFPNVLEKTASESVVCLTQEQLQQILNSIKASGQMVQEDSTASVQNGTVTDQERPSSEMARGTELALDGQTSSQGQEDEKKPLDSTSAGLFSTLGERELQREALEAKKAEWKRELVEQMALKKQQKEREWVLPQREQCTGPSSGHQPSGMPQDRKTKTGTENPTDMSTASKAQSNAKPLPSAIRSAFILGEATPLEHAFNDDKREEQRRWLRDLEQQREETKLRKKLEKQSQNQAEDHERWAMHFDSFQRRAPAQPPPVPGSDRGESCVGSSLSIHRAPSRALSAAWDAASAYGGDSLGRASVDTSRDIQPKASYLRTMTALLDPAQIEERERKRFKQLEHQRAIEAQVEERRRQKEKEEAARRALEEEEEKRLARERDLLQQQYLKEKQLQRQKEELQSRRTEELYRSVQRAREEAQKDKNRHTIRELSNQDLGVSGTFPSVEGESVSSKGSVNLIATDTTRSEDSHAGRKDTAVQTEMNTRTPSPDRELLNVHGGVKAPAGHRAPPNIKRSRRDARLAEKNNGKENMCMATKEADPYEPYARTDRTHGQQLSRRPDWNTQRPVKAFVPASERYPAALQRHRQESRMRRQMELMTLVERNAVSRMPQRDFSPPPSADSSHLPRNSHSARQKGEDSDGAQFTTQRVRSPPVPALKHRLHLYPPPPSRTEERSESAGRPPSSDYVPYVRTDEVYHLDPLAPISRPYTHDAQQKTHADVISSRQPTPLVLRDPLFHPELLKSTERQQAILKGLSELREGLLQKQRELETSLIPLQLDPSKSHSPTFQPM